MQKNSKAELQYLLILNLFLGIWAILLLLQVRKENTDTLLGYSQSRLILILVEITVFLLFVGISIWILKKESRTALFLDGLANAPLSSPVLLAIVIFFLVVFIGLTWIAVSGRWDQLGWLGVLIQRLLPFLLWPGTIPLQLYIYHHVIRKSWPSKTTAFSLLAVNIVIVYILLDTLLRTHSFGTRQFRSPAVTQFLTVFVYVAVLLAILFLLNKWSKTLSRNRLSTFLVIRNGLLVFLLMLLLYSASAISVGQTTTGEQAYSPDLAAALLRGHAYLENPESTIDLTYSNGKWYVPYPPLVAILMLPQVALFGPENINTVKFSIFFASINVALVFMILERLRIRGWTRIGQGANIWLTVLFGIGTVHWYLALWGEVWPLNQLTATTFIGIATLIALMEQPAWLAGLCLGVAMLARPHVAMAYPFLLGMYFQARAPWNLSNQWKSLLKLVISSGLALSMVVLVIFWYNYIRFGSPLDFGYQSSQLNIGLFVDQLRTYGQFNIHFVPRNLQVMLLSLPDWNAQCKFFSPGEIGMSILVTTPVLVYLVRARTLNPLTIGAWITVILFLIVLLLHYSTGAYQFGYRFLLDFLIPLIVLLAIALPYKRISLPVKLLILAGILVNYWGLWWMFRHWCQ